MLDEPLPGHFPMVRVCIDCNRDQSEAETYFYAILSAVLSGSHRPEDQILPIGERVLRSDKSLRRRIFEAKNIAPDGSLIWNVDHELIGQVLTAYARGHIFLETGELALDKPARVVFKPLATMGQDERTAFLEVQNDVFPELGSRLFITLFDPQDERRQLLDANGFFVIQPNTYQYKVVLRNGQIGIRSIVRNFLATEVSW
ncbi:hypothetical protein [Defluviimonas salinarum]|uniref:hypothetical protein n=1 Tax=Defluviimonas salinarum TaxID=2992147 RepID=UPI00222F6A91|nr:hypothetical protein [Defluviimonas salinarum]